jgi:Na+/proline symporter
VVITDYVQFVVLTTAVAVMFPFVFAGMGGFAGGMRMLAHESPSTFFSPIGGPLSIWYIAAFYLLVIVSYNGNSAFAQKFYCVRDEREACKAGMLATALKLIGPPLFILPAMAARHLMPELAQPPNSPQYTYAALAIKYLPAGLVGRLATLFAGAVTVAIGVYLAGTAKTGLFEVMVKLFTLFVGPMLIPMLAGLLNRSVTWRGAAAGTGAGFACGFAMYLYKSLVLAGRPGVDPDWLAHGYEALNIFATFGVTLLAMSLTTIFEKPTPEDIEKSQRFFGRLDAPVTRAEGAASREDEFSPLPMIGWMTTGIGVLLLIAAATLPSGTGQTVNIGVGIFLCLVGAGFHGLNRALNAKAVTACQEPVA